MDSLNKAFKFMTLGRLRNDDPNRQQGGNAHQQQRDNVQPGSSNTLPGVRSLNMPKPTPPVPKPPDTTDSVSSDTLKYTNPFMKSDSDEYFLNPPPAPHAFPSAPPQEQHIYPNVHHEHLYENNKSSTSSSSKSLPNREEGLKHRIEVRLG